MKLIAYILLAFGSLCEFAGVYMIIARLRGGAGAGYSAAIGLLLILLGLFNVFGFKMLQRGFDDRFKS